MQNQNNKGYQKGFLEGFQAEFDKFQETIEKVTRHIQTGNYLIDLKLTLEKEDAAAEQAAKMQPFIRQQAFLDFAQEYCETEAEHSDTED